MLLISDQTTNIKECIEELKEWTDHILFEITVLEHELKEEEKKKEENKKHQHEIIDLTEDTDED